ncbi:MraY family glycosyltransferase [Feifania hominis]|uniref:Undecaprenyl/decaprenyl-phosphate alpha-N-acetylglucosaminyl 1-phosphate transferase n=1 Tax=Feifania hominis TaxID=2763660 RepID=A0A926DC93_9FIRM|nr:MraY family glycosyltransferase [Feifania hominis]MBC8536320.1 undecaprenyl/decaprenyl-phosphate alpha-N-acetylglucosaminyl 1-phosphate transferase [Feifania hominis]
MSSQDIFTIVISFLLAGVISFATTPLVKVLAGRVGAIDVPRDSRRMHKVPIPRLGGLAIFFGFLITVLLFAFDQPHMGSILLGAVVIVVLGVLDDIMDLSAKLKFAVQIIAALIPVLSGVRIDILSSFNPFREGDFFRLGWLSIPVTVLWIVGITNAVNLIDGLDGLACGVSSIASVSLLIIAILATEPLVAITMAALCGACIGFLPYNFNPASIFMGDTGATFLGYILATMSIQGYFKFYALISFVVPFLILGLPIFDTAFAILRRVLSGRSPMSPDRGHLHHRLIDMGFSQKQTVAIMYTISAVLGLSAVLLTSTSFGKAMILIATAVILSIVAFKVIERHPHGTPAHREEPKESKRKDGPYE